MDDDGNEDINDDNIDFIADMKLQDKKRRRNGEIVASMKLPIESCIQRSASDSSLNSFEDVQLKRREAIGGVRNLIENAMDELQLRTMQAKYIIYIGFDRLS